MQNAAVIYCPLPYLAILKTGATLAPVSLDRQLISGLDVLQEDSGVDRIIVSGNGFGHVEVPSRSTVPAANKR